MFVTNVVKTCKVGKKIVYNNLLICFSLKDRQLSHDHTKKEKLLSQLDNAINTYNRDMCHK